ncbi:putative dehydrogenase [Edaphobacter aggregans]|jgi:glucose-fructose oxidoreductase|uniref:Putative dehydrogenase n=1 Tax=Edaphobacter aggregans TaxID=570835 RepID=A0A428MKG4_9BACT|nr:Gfo/Idh/MocA family oxidoreductase [Edaphobacter aggregans]RSL17350.1 putative dehydrogenase [Edaphobacter aggregans]
MSLSCRHIALKSLLIALLFSLPTSGFAQNGGPVRVAVVGLVHGHVQGFLHNLPSHPNVELVGISEPDAALRQKYAALFHLNESLFFPSEAAMLAATHPQAILVYTSIADHRAAIEQAAPLHIAAMVEKPLATTLDDALAIQHLSQQFQVPVLTNYETTWYASNTAANALLASGHIGELRKLVVHDGHRGPKEIGVGPEFLTWLTDPKQNGAGALFDFGCYGVDLATWMMHGELPVSVTAVAQQIKPDVYPHVDDEATILLAYPHAQAIIQASWNWPFDRKDMEVYGAKGFVGTVKAKDLRVRLPGDTEEHAEAAPPLASPQDDSLNYLVAVLEHRLEPKADLSSLDTNVAVVRILDAARQSARTGHTVQLAPDTAPHTGR